MNNRVDDAIHNPRSRGIGFEIMLASVLLAFGLFALPALIYAVGTVLLGPYLDPPRANGITLFYRTFFADLAAPTARAWLIAAGPLAVIVLFRLAFLGHRGGDSAPPPRAEPPRRSTTVARQQPGAPPKKPAAGRGGRRVEPRIGSD